MNQLIAIVILGFMLMGFLVYWLHFSIIEENRKYIEMYSKHINEMSKIDTKFIVEMNKGMYKGITYRLDDLKDEMREK